MDGIIIVDKPQGWTSHDVVNFFRKRFGVKKVGHAGTLDPMATGVLVLLVGKATKRSGEFSSHDKEYQAKLTFGATTDTQDSTGNIVEKKNFNELSNDSIKGAFSKFLGETDQVPPMVSAIKSGGQRLYALARRGITIERKPRRIEIKKIDILDIKLPDVIFNVTCSKGTYVRTLCHDIGESLGCGGHLSGLRRTRSGRFSVDEAVTIEKLKQLELQDLKHFLKDEFQNN